MQPRGHHQRAPTGLNFSGRAKLAELPASHHRLRPATPEPSGPRTVPKVSLSFASEEQKVGNAGDYIESRFTKLLLLPSTSISLTHSVVSGSIGKINILCSL